MNPAPLLALFEVRDHRRDRSRLDARRRRPAASRQVVERPAVFRIAAHHSAHARHRSRLAHGDRGARVAARPGHRAMARRFGGAARQQRAGFGACRRARCAVGRPACCAVHGRVELVDRGRSGSRRSRRACFSASAPFRASAAPASPSPSSTRASLRIRRSMEKCSAMSARSPAIRRPAMRTGTARTSPGSSRATAARRST